MSAAAAQKLYPVNFSQQAVIKLSNICSTMADTHKVTLEYMETLTFEGITDFLRRKEVLTHFRIFLVELFSTYFDTLPASEADPLRTLLSNTNVCFLLKSYLLAIHPTRVIETPTDETRTLVQAGKNFVDQISRVVNVLRMPVKESTTIFKTFHVPLLCKDLTKAALVEFIPKFIVWKKKDEEILVGRMKHAIWSLVGATVRLMGDSERMDMQNPLVIQLQDQVERLRGMLGTFSRGQRLAELDADIAREMNERRNYLLLCQEFKRNGIHGFDFI